MYIVCASSLLALEVYPACHDIAERRDVFKSVDSSNKFNSELIFKKVPRQFFCSNGYNFEYDTNRQILLAYMVAMN